MTAAPTIRLTVAQAVVHLPVPAVLRRRRRAPPADPGHARHLRPRQRRRPRPGPRPAQRRPCRSSRAATSRPWCTLAIGFAKALPPARHPGGHRVHRSRRAEPGHRCRAGHGEPAAGAAAARRHLRHPPPGPGAAAAAAPGRGRPHASTTCSGRSRRFFDRITRPEQLLTALPAAMRVARRPGRDRCRGAVPAAGRPVPRLRLPRGVLRRARLDRSAGRPPTPTRSPRSPTCSPRRAKPIIIAGGGVDLLRRHRRARGRSPTPSASRSPRPSRGKGAVQQRRLVAGRRHRPRGQPRPPTTLARRGRPRAHRRVPAHRLRHRLALDLRQPRRAVRQHQRQPARRATGSAPSASSATPSAPWPRCAEAVDRPACTRRPAWRAPGRGAAGGLGARACRALDPDTAVRHRRRCRPSPTTSSPTPTPCSPRASSSALLQEHAQRRRRDRRRRRRTAR